QPAIILLELGGACLVPTEDVLRVVLPDHPDVVRLERVRKRAPDESLAEAPEVFRPRVPQDRVPLEDRPALGVLTDPDLPHRKRPGLLPLNRRSLRHPSLLRRGDDAIAPVVRRRVAFRRLDLERVVIGPEPLARD